MSRKILVVDIGGTFMKYAFMTEEGEIRSRGKEETPQDSREHFLDVLEEIFQREDHVDGISICLPGIVDYEKGQIVMGGGIPNNEGFFLRDALQERCPVPIWIENDAKCAAMAEAASGALKDVKDAVVLLFGTMVGGGIIKDHKLHRGAHSAAGEVSYIAGVGAPTFANVFGNQCGVPRLCREYAAMKTLDPSTVDGEMVFRAVDEGDEEAIAALDEFTREIAVQVFNLQTFYDPELFAIGGGISEQDVFIEGIRTHLKSLYRMCPWPIPQAEVVPCKYRNEANLIGALSCFLTEFPAGFSGNGVL